MKLHLFIRKMFFLYILAFSLVISACGGAPYSDPPPSFSAEDVAGIWEANYSKGRIDKLIINEDGQFQQIYIDNSVDNFVFETLSSPWEIEELPDGRIRLHFIGAKYFMAGVSFAEHDGRYPQCPADQPNCWGGETPPPRPFYDPIGNELTDMIGELIVNLQLNRVGEYVLVQMWTSRERGFSLLDGGSEVFRRID